MNKLNDIGDDEIRIISRGVNGIQSPSQPDSGDSKKSPWGRVGCVAIVVAIIVAVVWLLFWHSSDDTTEQESLAVTTEGASNSDEVVLHKKGYVEILDTVVGRVPLVVLTPHDAVPSLHVGADVLQSKDVVLAMQAADIRSDNGGIVGAFVVEGNLLSRGKAKTGFCAIIDGTITIGAADATPLFEKTIESGGYFFRQFPLVVGNQVVENKPRGDSLRKALAEWRGAIVVVMSRTAMSYHDFSQILVDMGVTNAIYLVGSSSAGFAVNSHGIRTNYGEPSPPLYENVNYIVWR
ncbi:MAG: phosphodiester glycosidase family protein [Candidatus Limisoma sp.]|nr:phosphodiester glycosidase family protein [Candidatus Limisoma sp.]